MSTPLRDAEPLPVSLSGYGARARSILAGPHWDGLFSERGDRMWQTNQANIAAYAGWTFRPRVLTGIGERRLVTTMLGHAIKLPIAVAPSAAHQKVHPQGELATVRAAGRAGTLTILSTLSNFSVDELAAAASGPLWLQLYFLQDRELTLWLVRRAEAAGFNALVVSVDNVAGRPPLAERQRLYGLASVPPPRTHEEPHRVLSNFATLPPEVRPRSIVDLIEPTLSWRDIEWLQSQTRLPVVVKGIQTSEDARICRDLGMKALIVSNHGGVPVELEGVRATADALPEIADAVGGEIELYVDGGIRTGHDVLKALALGARAVLTGRPIQWGLAVGGEDGAFGILDTLRRELDSIMGICGVEDVNAVPRTLVERTRIG